MADGRTTVVHLITLLEFGGAQGNTIYTVEHLNPKKFDVYLWSGRGAYWDRYVEQNPELKKRTRYFKSLVRPVNPLWDFIAVFSLWRALEKLKPAILHTHSSKAGIVGRIAGWLAGVPVIIHTFHGFGFNDEQRALTRWFFVWLEKAMAPLATKLIFVSEANRRTAQELKIGRDGQYELIRSGVPLTEIRRHSKTKKSDYRDLGPEQSPWIVTIGAFKPQKNLSDFLIAAKKIRESFPTAFFIMLGDGELRSQLESEVDSLGLSGHIVMPGWRQDATRILAASDVFVMTSLWEGLPRALVEALALEKPSVCYDTDGVRDILGAEDGSLVSRHDTSRLAEKVVSLLSNNALYAKVASQSAQRIGRDFDIDEMVIQQERLYNSL